MSVRVFGVPRDDGAPSWSVDMVYWWSLKALEREVPVREIAEDGYTDRVAVLTIDEARSWNERFVSKAAVADWATRDRLTTLLREGPPNAVFVIVNEYEWETGLGD